MIIEKKKIADLIPAPYNPRQSTAKQEKHLKESLEKFGLVEPIIFNKQTGYIVGGHFRVRELKKLGITEIECVIVDLNEADEKELNIRLNANTGGWDWETLANDWEVVDLEAWGLEIPQFDTVEELEASEEEEEQSNVIELKFNNEYYNIVKAKLNAISGSPEWAVLKLLGVE
jgi:ParB-like chromosome segregation protein Spo0J